MKNGKAEKHVRQANMCSCCAAAVKTQQSNSTGNRNISTRSFAKISTSASQPVDKWMWSCCLAGGVNATRSCQNQQQQIMMSEERRRNGTELRALTKKTPPGKFFVRLTWANLLSRRGPGVAACSTHFIRDPPATLWITLRPLCSTFVSRRCSPLCLCSRQQASSSLF